MSNSTFVKVLVVDVHVDVEAIYPVELGDYSDDDADSFNSGSPYTEVAEEKAHELFLDCGLLEPLGELTNVEKFDIKFMILDSREYNRPARHTDMLRELKSKIESNCKQLTQLEIKAWDNDRMARLS